MKGKFWSITGSYWHKEEGKPEWELDFHLDGDNRDWQSLWKNHSNSRQPLMNEKRKYERCMRETMTTGAYKLWYYVEITCSRSHNGITFSHYYKELTFSLDYKGQGYNLFKHCL